jgi:hypothetical protein
MNYSLKLLAALLLMPTGLKSDESRHPDVMKLPADIKNPAITDDAPAPGKMVLQSLPSYAGTAVAHTLYLPSEWEKGKRYPVMIEYLGNKNRVRDNSGIGYALSGGKGVIWAVLPFVSVDGKQDMDQWWGDVNATVAYAKEVVPAICRQWGGDPSQVILTGYSRGAIACNFIGLHDDEIAKLWRAVIVVSHYDDGHTAWGMKPEEQNRAAERLRRLGKTPQLISGEYASRSLNDVKLLQSIKDKNLSTFAAAKTELQLEPLIEIEHTRQFISQHHPLGVFTFVNLPWVNHGVTVLHRDTPERRQLRDWLQQVLRNPPQK